MSKPVKIGDKCYKSQKDCITDIKNIITNIGVTSSIKSISLRDFEFFYDLTKRHHASAEKLKSLSDFAIRRDRLNPQAFAIDIVNTDGTITELSWKKCVSGKKETQHSLFHSALRHSIAQQILDFKEKERDVQSCSLCMQPLENRVIHIDHINHFVKIVEDFMNLYQDQITVPDEYDKEPGTYMTMFKEKDKHIGSLFYNFHLEHATLRVVCSVCNLNREKYSS